jgi:antitoxin ParD1/3/4
MKSFNVTMPEELLDYVRHRTKAGGFGTPTEFLRHLIRKDQDERARRELEARLLEGLKSPRSRVAPKTFFKRMHALIDEVADVKRKKRRNGTATRSAARR